MAVAALILVASVLAFGLWYQSRHPREIIATSTVMVESRRAGQQRLTLQVRTVRIAAATFQEIQMPNGTWIGCAGDCREAARDASDQFWDAQDKSRK